MQQAKFRGSDVREIAAHRERHGLTMQLKIGSGNASSQRLLKPTQDRTDTRRKFASPKRFGDVIVGPKIQTADPVFFACPCRQENNGDAGKIGAFANLPADLQAAVTGDHNVEQK